MCTHSTLHLLGVFSPHLGSGSKKCNVLFDHRQQAHAGISQVACGLATDGGCVETSLSVDKKVVWQPGATTQRPTIHNPWMFCCASWGTVCIHPSFLYTHTFLLSTFQACTKKLAWEALSASLQSKGQEQQCAMKAEEG